MDKDTVYAVINESGKVIELYHDYADADTRALELQQEEGIEYTVESFSVY